MLDFLADRPGGVHGMMIPACDQVRYEGLGLERPHGNGINGGSSPGHCSAAQARLMRVQASSSASVEVAYEIRK
jgi:hypothetical protein